MVFSLFIIDKIEQHFFKIQRKLIMKTLLNFPLLSCKKIPFAASSLFITLLLMSMFVQAQPSPSMPKIALQLLLNENGGTQNSADGLVVVFDPSFSKAVGPEDSYKFTNIDENMAVNRNGINLSIEGRPNITDFDTIPLKVWQYRHNNYCLKFLCSNFSTTLAAVLKDNYLQQDFPINMDTTTCINYNITSDPASYASDRLCIVFKPASSLPLNISGLAGYIKDKGIQIDWRSQSDVSVINYAIEKSNTGQQFSEVAKIISKESNSAQNYSWYDASPLSGTNLYRIRLTERSGQIKYSSIVKVNTSKSVSGISVFPNPAKGDRIGLQMENIEKGNYKAILYNNSGQVVNTQNILFEGGSASKIIQMTNVVKKGTYTLLLANENNKFTTRIIID